MPLSFEFCCLSQARLFGKLFLTFLRLSSGYEICALLGLTWSTSGSNVVSGTPSDHGCPERPIAAPQIEAQQRRRSPHSYRSAAQLHQKFGWQTGSAGGCSARRHLEGCRPGSFEGYPTIFDLAVVNADIARPRNTPYLYHDLCVLRFTCWI